MSTATALRRSASLAATVTMLSSLAVPSAALAQDAAPDCTVTDGVLSCPTAEAPAPEEPAAEEPATQEQPPEVACQVMPVDGALTLVCTEVVAEPAPAPAPAPAPVPAPAPAPEVEVELPLSLTDGLATEQAVDACVPGVVVLAPSVVGDCAPAAVFSGDAAGDLALGNLLSRGQAATALHRMLELTDLAGLPSGADHFSDDDGTTHEAAVNALADFGILTGTADGRADAAGSVTGAQFASMVHRTLVHTGHFATGATTHTAAAADLEALGITLPSGALTRGETAGVLEALLGHLQA